MIENKGYNTYTRVPDPVEKKLMSTIQRYFSEGGEINESSPEAIITETYNRLLPVLRQQIVSSTDTLVTQAYLNEFEVRLNARLDKIEELIKNQGV